MIAILGAGSWGAGLALALGRSRHQVCIWSPFEEEAEQLRRSRRLPHKLPGVVLPAAIEITADLHTALAQATAVLIAVPSEFMRRTVAAAAELKSQPDGCIWITCTKGIEAGTCLTMSQILKEHLPGDVAALSGPSHAEEVSIDLPTAVVAASERLETAKRVQELFLQPTFRVYTNTDILGVELGGALKNVIAIATGIADGLGYGDNARAAIMTRGLAEIARLGTVMGAQPETFAGLSGMGDLVVTCTSRHSRNRRLGELLAKGYDLDAAQEELGMVAEGVSTAKAIDSLQAKYRVETPISREVAKILFEGLDPKMAVTNLLSRAGRSE